MSAPERGTHEKRQLDIVFLSKYPSRKLSVETCSVLKTRMLLTFLISSKSSLNPFATALIHDF